MRRLNLDQLRAVVEVVRLGSFSAAAQRLNLTQPAVSFQVRELEERLGIPLLRSFAWEAKEIGDRPRFSNASIIEEAECLSNAPCCSLDDPMCLPPHDVRALPQFPP